MSDALIEGWCHYTDKLQRGGLPQLLYTQERESATLADSGVMQICNLLGGNPGDLAFVNKRRFLLIKQSVTLQSLSLIWKRTKYTTPTCKSFLENLPGSCQLLMTHAPLALMSSHFIEFGSEERPNELRTLCSSDKLFQITASPSTALDSTGPCSPPALPLALPAFSASSIFCPWLWQCL